LSDALRLVRWEAEEAAWDMAVSHALLRRVAAGELPPTLRLYRPARAVAFGRLDALRPGFGAAVEAARARGFEPVLRVAGGHAAAYDRGSVGLDLLVPDADPVPRMHERFEVAGARLTDALRALGVDARVGEVPGEYCPGAYSVNARGAVKLVGAAQRVVRGGSLLAAVVVAGGGARVRAVLADVYRALALEWDERTAGAVEDEVPGAGPDAVEAAIRAAYGRHHDLWPGELDPATLDLAGELVGAHRLGPGARVRATRPG
jgi:octanoyl-[GcvH]:protein N-octanoyltransferase